MKSAISALLFFAIAFQTFQAELSAQDYRIYTKVSHQQGSSSGQTPKVVARTLTICHAGKIYDYMVGVEELVVYDPHHQRFTVISSPYHMACTVEFSELRQHLKVARSQAKEYLKALGESQLPNAYKKAELVAFQLDPHFKMEFSPEKNLLSCTSPQMSYLVKTVRAPSPEMADAFRQYTDWAAQLNFVLHGKSSMPAPRIQLNKYLVEHQLLPVEVTLTLADSENTKLVAEHIIDWKLSKDDRFKITNWKHELRDGNLKFVSFHEYQKKLLAR